MGFMNRQYLAKRGKEKGNERSETRGARSASKAKALKKVKGMVKVSHKGPIGYTIEDHKGNVLKKG